MPEVQLDGIKAGFDRDLCGVGELPRRLPDLRHGDAARELERRRIEEATRGHALLPGDLLVGHHAGMSELRRGLGSGCVHGVGELP